MGSDPQAPAENEPAKGALGTRAARGAVASVIGLGAEQGLRLAGNVILSRLLFPEAFGLMALANLLLTGLQLMSSVGIQPAIIRHPRGEERVFRNTAWTIEAARGGLIWLVALAAAVPLARIYEQPELVAIVPAVTFAAVILGFQSMRLALETRRLHLGRVTAIEATERAVAVVVMCLVAWWTRSVWALVVGGLVGVSVRVLLSHTLLPGERDRLAWDRDAARELFAFGKWIFVAVLFTFLALRIDVVLLGKLLPIATLGVYSIAIMLPLLLGQVSGRLIQNVLMPALSESYRGGETRLAENFDRARSLMLPLGLLATLGLAVVSPSFFFYLYDARYHDAGWIAQLALLPVWFTFLQESAGRVLLAWGDSRSWAFSNIVKTVASAAGCWLGFLAGGLPGLIVGAGAGAACGYLFVALKIACGGVPTLLRDAGFTLLGAAFAALAIPGAAAAARALALPDAPWCLGLLGLVALAPLALYVGWLGLRTARR